jgi:hypothetical protein
VNARLTMFSMKHRMMIGHHDGRWGGDESGGDGLFGIERRALVQQLGQIERYQP